MDPLRPGGEEDDPDVAVEQVASGALVRPDVARPESLRGYIDNLRSVNVAHGYTGGDRVLKEISRALLLTIKPGDAIGRAGGGKMVGVLAGVSLADAGVMAERMRLEVAEVLEVSLATVKRDWSLISVRFDAKIESLDR